MEVETGGTEAHLATKRLECPLQDVFEDYTPFPIRKRALKGNSGINIKIKMINNPVDNIRTERRNSSAFHHRTQSLPNEASVFPDGVLYKHAILNENQYSYDENDDSAGDMSFYQETHEDQLQSYRDLMKKRKEDALREGLARLDKEDREGRMSIESILSEQIKEKKAAAERSVERFKARVKEDEKRDRQRLNTLYQERTTSNQQKIAQSLKLLQRRQQKEIQAAMQHHQQKVQQRQLPEQMVSADWQNILRQLQSKHQRQLQEFNGKRDEIKKKTDADFKREEEKIRTSCETKLQEADNNNQKISAKIYNHFQQLRQRYFKRHLQTVMKKREDLNKSWRNAQDATNSDADDDPDLNSRDVVKSSDDKAELNPPSPIRSMQPWAEMPNHPHSGAAARHKHRKGVMSQTRRQLSVEIHNEGVWVLIMKSDSSSEEDDKRSQTVKADAISGGGDNTFIPWGLMAHSFLESIICGEIPDALHHAKVFDELAEIQGGQIRCIIADLRTSEETASSQRANSVRDIEVSEMELLQKKCVELNKVLAETEKEIMKVQSEEKECLTAAEAASKEVAKARRCQDDFRNKFRGYFGQDGNPLPTTNPSDRQELVKAMMQYKTHLETAMRREQTLKQKLAYSRTQLQRLQVQVKTASKDAQLASTEFAQKRTSLGQSQQSSSSSKSTKAAKNKQIAVEDKDRVAIRVKDCVAALSKTAEKRREASRQKQSNSFSSAWVQSLPGLSNSLKKSLWHKMHRRKQQIVLRPTEESLANGLLTFVADKMRPKSETPENQKQDEDKLLAEQLFLLAMHPLCEEELSTHPPTRNSESWAEPGWKLVLDTRRTCHSEHAILPSSSVTPLLGQNISEMSSTPGRQAASLIRSWNLRCLSSPLSSFTIASSPAEPAASPLTRKYADDDPLFATKDEIEKSYCFTLVQPNMQPTTQSRKKPQSGKAQVNEGKPTKEASASQTSSSLDRVTNKNSKSAKTSEVPVAESKKRRSTRAPSASPRAQKKKTEQVSEPSRPQSQTAAHLKRPSIAGQMNIPVMQNSYGTHASTQSKKSPTQQQSQTSVSQTLGAHQQQPQQPPQQTQPPQHQYSVQQMAQFQMMQQQQNSSSVLQVNSSYAPQMQQFYTPMSHSSTGSPGMPNPIPNQMQLQQRHQMQQQLMQPPGHQMNQGQSYSLQVGQQQQQQQQPQQQANFSNDLQTDPLFMLK